jgi:hypothetical protein
MSESVTQASLPDGVRGAMALLNEKPAHFGRLIGHSF